MSVVPNMEHWMLQAMPKGDGKVLERLGDREVPGTAEMLSVAGVW